MEPPILKILNEDKMVNVHTDCLNRELKSEKDLEKDDE